MSYEFRVVPHSVIPGEQMVECWRDGRFVAGISAFTLTRKAFVSSANTWQT